MGNMDFFFYDFIHDLCKKKHPMYKLLSFTVENTLTENYPIRLRDLGTLHDHVPFDNIFYCLHLFCTFSLKSVSEKLQLIFEFLRKH